MWVSVPSTQHKSHESSPGRLSGDVECVPAGRARQDGSRCSGACESVRYRRNTHTHTHTHTRTFNGPFSGTTQVSRYQKGKPNLDFTGARDSEWQWHQLGRMQVCTSLQTDNHASTPPLSFSQAGCPSCRPTNSVKALKACRRNTRRAIIYLYAVARRITRAIRVRAPHQPRGAEWTKIGPRRSPA